MRNNVFSGRVIFDHLPKTGGSALAAWLREILGTGCVTPNVWGGHRDLIRIYGGLHSVISGHLSYYNNDMLDPRYQYITCVREPVDRAVSWIFFCMHDAPKNEHSMLIKKAIPAFLESDGEECAPELLRTIANIYVTHFCHVGNSSEVGDDEKLQNAINAIHRYEVVGIYEDYSRFIRDTGRLIGIDPPEQITKVNVTTRRPRVDEISSGLRSRLTSLNQLDLCFYAEVVNWSSRDNRVPSRPAVPWRKYESNTTSVVTNVEGTISTGAVSFLSAGTATTVYVDIMNESSERWVGDTYNPINVSYHWLELSGKPHVFDGWRTGLPEQGIMPGDNVTLGMRILAPEERGYYTLVLTLVQEGVCWFEHRGFKPAVLKIEVL